MRLLLFAVRRGRGNAAAESLTQKYLGQISGLYHAEQRIFRSESELVVGCATLSKSIACALWLLDSQGTSLSSEGCAARMRMERENGRRVLIAAVGPANGWCETTIHDLREAGAFTLSLGPMTLPHELARLVMAEQMYRAVTILTGHPYHLGHE